MLASPDTIAALATPTGRSALALVRASGPAAGAIARALLGREPIPRRAQRTDYRGVDGTVLDAVVLTFFAAPKSFTGEDLLEISCHGNPLIVRRLLDDLFARGCRAAEPGEFTRRAFLHGRVDLSQAEAVSDLIHARSERALDAANQQLRGALGRRMTELINLQVSILARIEAYIDFPEEDLPAEDRIAVLRDVLQLEEALGRLVATNRYGSLLRDGVRTVILGAPNVGKSSLLNRLVGRERALVSPEPGTTRDYLEEIVAIGPHALRLVDTAGLNPTPAALERRGIEKTWEQVAEADLVLWVVDASGPLPVLPPDLAQQLNPRNCLLVWNKTDLSPPVPDSHPTLPTVSVSALSGAGFAALQSALLRLVEIARTDTGDELIAINARHADALRRALGDLGRARLGLEQDEPIELVASNLRGCLDSLGEISGRVDHERILDALFATFCIGK